MDRRPQLLLNVQGTPKGGSSPCSLALRVAPVPLRAFDPPCTFSKPLKPVGSNEWSYRSHQRMVQIGSPKTFRRSRLTFGASCKVLGDVL
jgi:hypothetical protein